MATIRSWTTEDDLSLIENHIIYSCKWASIARSMSSGFSPLDVKNHWYEKFLFCSVTNFGCICPIA